MLCVVMVGSVIANANRVKRKEKGKLRFRVDYILSIAACRPVRKRRASARPKNSSRPLRTSESSRAVSFPSIPTFRQSHPSQPRSPLQHDLHPRYSSPDLDLDPRARNHQTRQIALLRNRRDFPPHRLSFGILKTRDGPLECRVFDYARLAGFGRRRTGSGFTIVWNLSGDGEAYQEVLDAGESHAL